jgi:putative transposase
VKSNREKAKKRKTGLAFNMKFKSAKADSDSIVISKKKCAREVALLSNMKTERGRSLNMKWDHDARLQQTRDGRFHLCIPKPTVVVSDSQAPTSQWANDGVVALDPGVRTFMTGFDALGNVFEWGPGDVQRICRLQHHLDRLHNRIREPSRPHRSRYNMRKAASRLQNRISQLVDEMHRKLCKWLCENYRVIFLPKFEIRRMVKKGQRKLSRRTVRSLYVLRHYTFRQRLLSKAREYPWVQVFLVNEAHTSKTCTHCGWSHPTLGGNKVFECAQCHQITPRDVGGARNILLRQLSVLNTQLP